jgi:hypothetical protein
VGEAAIRALYGDPRQFIRDDGTLSPIWEARMTVVQFPQPLPLGWERSKFAKGARVNQAIAAEVDTACRLLAKEGLWPRLRTFDGAYAFRAQRGSSTKTSMHSFGAALDFNAETNQLGTPGDMDLGVIQIFEGCGWTWGGRWKRKDGMHFSLAPATSQVAGPDGEEAVC